MPIQTPFPGSTSLQQTGLPQEFNATLLRNLQATAASGRRAAKRDASDVGARFPGLSGAVTQNFREIDRDFADSLLSNASNVQLQGAQQSLTGRRINEQREFTGQQNQLNRDLTSNLAQQQLAFSKMSLQAGIDQAQADKLFEIMKSGFALPFIL